MLACGQNLPFAYRFDGVVFRRAKGTEDLIILGEVEAAFMERMLAQKMHCRQIQKSAA